MRRSFVRILHTCARGGPGTCGPADASLIGNWDPRNIKAMKLPWQNYPDSGPYWQNPPGTGGIESDISLAYGNVYVATYNAPAYLTGQFL